MAQRYPDAVPRAECWRARSEIGLDPAYVYGLIRQESRFVMDARSHVGASGLMQVMPATARWTAQADRPALHAASMITDRDINLQLGTGYLKLVLDDFGGSLADGRRGLQRRPGPAAPLARRRRSSSRAIWAENIPFNETRDYVKKVLSNATDYAALLGAPGAPSLKARLGAGDRPARRAAPRRRQGAAMTAPRAGARTAGSVPDAACWCSAAPASSAARCAKGWSARGARRASSCRRAAPRTRKRLRSLPTVELRGGRRARRRGAGARCSRGCDAVVNLVAILHGSERDFERVHVALPRRLARACAAAGVRRVRARQRARRRRRRAVELPAQQDRRRSGAARRRAGPDGAAALGDLRCRRPLPEPVRDSCRRCSR